MLKQILVSISLVLLPSLASAMQNDHLFQLIHRGDIESLRRSLATGIFINAQNKYGNTVLAEAVLQGNKDIVSLFINARAPVNVQDNMGMTPLMNAVIQDREDLVTMLLRADANPNLVDRNGTCALSFAARLGLETIVRILIEYGADVTRADNKKETPIVHAAKQNQLDIVALLALVGSPLKGLELYPKALATAQQILEQSQPSKEEQNKQKGLKFIYGLEAQRGRRPSMEDAHVAQVPFADNPAMAFFGIFDGHGGADVAHYCAKNLMPALQQCPLFSSNMRAALIQAIEKTNSDLGKSDLKDAAEFMGSTAIVAVIKDNDLFIANVGDSRAILSRGGKAVALSQDQNPTRPDEFERIKNAGGFVRDNRVGGTLAVSRAFGDFVLKSVGLIATPEIEHTEIQPEDEFLILTCDGIFESNILTRQNAVDIVRGVLAKYKDDPLAPTKAAQELVITAYNRKSGDNLSALVVVFKRS